MVLFDVPGWSISDIPVAVIPKKRKPSSKNDLNKVQLATANIELLKDQLAASPSMKGKSGVVTAVQCDQPPKKKPRRANSNKAQQPQTPAGWQGDAPQGALGKKKKKRERTKERADEAPASLSPSSSQPPPPSPRGTLTSLQHSMKQNLDGARFRYAIYSPPLSLRGHSSTRFETSAG
jgi:hypothetical protein